MTTTDRDRKQEEKRARSEASRAAALRNLGEESRRQSSLVAQSLSNVDNPSASKRKVFDSDDDDEIAPAENSGLLQVSSSKRPKLFKGDESDEEAEEITIKNKHVGKKGLKLMEQQARIGADDRFKLDENFVDSEEEEDEDEHGMELRAEKNAALDVLAKVLGKNVRKEDKSAGKKKDDLGSRPFTRFDPDNAEHVEWMRKFTEKDKEKKRKNNEVVDDKENSESEEEKNAEKIVVEGRFFEMGGSFASELKATLEGKKKEEEAFSFLASVGRKADEKTESQKSFAVAANVKPAESAKKKKKTEEVEDNEPVGFDKPSGGFFIDVFSGPARSIVTNFRRTQSDDKIRAKWEKTRDSIVAMYKSQRHTALRNLRADQRRQQMRGGGKSEHGERTKIQK